MSSTSYVPRSPRRATRLRAIVDDGAHHAVGAVRDMSTSGLFVEGPESFRPSSLIVGSRVAVVPLIGELDGERLPAEVARVVDRGVALRFLGLDAEQRQQLRRTFAGDEMNPLIEHPRRASSIVRDALPPIPESAPVFLLTDEPAPPEHPKETSGDVLLTMRGTIERLEAQLFELSKKNHVLLDENARLKKETMAQQARLSVALSLRMRVDDDLTEARAALDDLERGEDALLRRIQTLERLLNMAMIGPAHAWA